MRSLLQKVRNKFEVAIAEVGANDIWSSALLGIVSVSNESGHADRIVSAALAFIEDSRPDCEVAIHIREVTRIGDAS